MVKAGGDIKDGEEAELLAENLRLSNGVVCLAYRYSMLS